MNAPTAQRVAEALALIPDCEDFGILTLQRAREVFNYEPETGLIRWKFAVSQKVKAGQVAGGLNVADGYIQIRIDNKIHRAHRIAFLLMTGAWPSGHVDHINGVRNDNRWVNLRDVTQQVNKQNRRLPNRGNPSGFLGVSIDKRNGRFKAKIGVDGRDLNLGVFDTAEEAHDVYLAAKRRYHAGCYFCAAADLARAQRQEQEH